MMADLTKLSSFLDLGKLTRGFWTRTLEERSRRYNLASTAGTPPSATVAPSMGASGGPPRSVVGPRSAPGHNQTTSQASSVISADIAAIVLEMRRHDQQLHAMMTGLGESLNRLHHRLSDRDAVSGYESRLRSVETRTARLWGRRYLKTRKAKQRRRQQGS
ncbi:hypothetical protein CKAH01_12251 [Colletotrichum kahawae]|uniref:Uncharacterized protein n=1 Tax=Colletotrichum kahawae TaxID=34407 RepID=A0AAD9YTA0_COLKA|nr:hypothetical protein CKAH01_12251 [Colletotrichum kahawae]